MDRYRANTSTFFSKLANGLGMKQRPLSKSLGPPEPQTSHIFELPDELILSVASYVSALPEPTGHYARFRSQYNMDTSDYHQRRVTLLLSLSMTCRAMRLRLLPWIWERIEAFSGEWVGGEGLMRRPKAIVSAVRADPYLGMSVKSLTMHLTYESTIPLFVECLESLPNLHTLEVPWAHVRVTGALEDALEYIELPQIRTLIIPPTAHTLLRHCHGVEDLVFVVRYAPTPTPSDKIFISLVSNRDLKIKRLAIPLVSWVNPSRFVTACPRLTELTIVCPQQGSIEPPETRYHFDPVGSARSATSELVDARKALPDFDTLQIVYGCGVMYNEVGLVAKQRRRVLREHADSTKGWAINCLKDPGTEGREREGTPKKITVRVIELIVNASHPQLHLDSVKVEVYEV